MNSPVARALRELRTHCRGEVLDEPDALAGCARDFGGMCERTPAIVVRVAIAADVVTALRVAGEHALPVTTRGAGHSQAGQGLGAGLVLDMTRLDRVLSVDRERRSVEVEGGATWRTVVDATFAAGMLPIGLTHALDTTVAGTLSIGGVGAESFRVGPQVDNVEFVEVATLAGTVEHCSREHNRELFDAVRAGLGQCGVILRAGYPLRSCKPAIHMRGYAYREVGRFLDDAALVADRQANGRWLASSLTRDPFRPSRWLLLLFVGHDAEPQDQALAPLLPLAADFELPARSLPTWRADGTPGHAFFHVFGSSAREPGPPSLNPWVEHVFPARSAATALETMLDRGVHALGGGRAGVIFLRRGPQPAPLFVVPDGDLLTGVGLFATFFGSQRPIAEGAMATYAENMRPLGGKRYLSGYVTATSASDWAQHYENVWPQFSAAKLRHDPGGLLNRGFIHWG